MRVLEKGRYITNSGGHVIGFTDTDHTWVTSSKFGSARFTLDNISDDYVERPGIHCRLLYVPLPDFDEGGLKRNPDGTLESVHIPKEEEMHPVHIPYAPNGQGSVPVKKPVLEWQIGKSGISCDGVYDITVDLLVDKVLESRARFKRPPARLFTRRAERRAEKQIAKAKENLLRMHFLLRRESGPVNV